MKSLILKKGGVTYQMTDWNIATYVDKMCQVISGMDTNGMYFQIKIKSLEEKVEFKEDIDTTTIIITKKKSAR